MYATISADVVSSTSLSVNETLFLKQKIESLFELLEKKFEGFWGRLIKGDYIECVVDDASKVFRIALIFKTYIKSLDVEETKDKKLFNNFGLRISIGIGDMRIIDKEKGIMDGEAIYLSGRNIDNMGSLNKGTMIIDIENDNLRASLKTISILTDALLNNATKRQCDVLFYKLLNYNEQEIADVLGIKQSGVNQHSSLAKWYCIEQALDYFENLNFNT